MGRKEGRTIFMRKFVRSDGSVGVGRLICSFEQRSTNSQVFYNDAVQVQICRKRRRLGCVNSHPRPEGARRRDSRNLAFIFSAYLYA